MYSQIVEEHFLQNILQDRPTFKTSKISAFKILSIKSVTYIFILIQFINFFNKL